MNRVLLFLRGPRRVSAQPRPSDPAVIGAAQSSSHQGVHPVLVLALSCLTRFQEWVSPVTNAVQRFWGRRRRRSFEGRPSMNVQFVDIPTESRPRGGTDEFSFVLKPSRVSGVGVFATHHIPEGSHLDLFPNGSLRFFSHDRMEADPRLRAFCHFFGVESETGCFVPGNFGCMSIGCYLNHCETPNAYHRNFEYYASRDIAAGEEILIDYRVLW